MSNTDWDNISEIHNANFPGLNKTSNSLKCKFQELAWAKIKTGDPNMPPHICVAKRAYYAIVKKTDGGGEEGNN